MKAQIMCTTERAKKIIFGLWCFALMYCSPWLGLSAILCEIDVKGDVMETCGYRLERKQYRVYYAIDLVIFYIVPLLITGVLYSSIVHMLYNTSLYCSRKTLRVDDRKKTAASSRRQVSSYLS